MKVAFSFLVMLSFVGCETITNEDGTTTTRFDAESANSLINTGFSTYDRYQQYSRPAYQQPLYPAQGGVIYPMVPQY